jgi:preprotein translocase subunit YajC
MNAFFSLMAAPQTGAAAGAAGAGGAAATGSAAGSLISTIIPFALIIVIFYFLLIRPQNKKQKETKKMLSALKKGDKDVTIGGIHGAITKVKENSVVLKVDDGTQIEFSRSAINNVEAVAPDKDDDDDDDSKSDDKDKKEDTKAIEDKTVKAEEAPAKKPKLFGEKK